MNLSPYALVRQVLAKYAGEETIERRHDLVRDLGLDRIEIVLAAMRLKELAKGEFDLVNFDQLDTVADLEDMVWSWVHGIAVTEGRRFDSGIMLKREPVEPLTELAAAGRARRESVKP